MGGGKVGKVSLGNHWLFSKKQVLRVMTEIMNLNLTDEINRMKPRLCSVCLTRDSPLSNTPLLTNFLSIRQLPHHLITLINKALQLSLTGQNIFNNFLSFRAEK